MSKEQLDYSKFTLDPNKPVEVPITVWSTLFRVLTKLSEEENKSVTEYVYSYYHKDTRKKLSNSGKKKMSKKKLEKEYYRDIDLEATRNNKKLQTLTNSLGLISLELLSAFDNIFKQNVDSGNRIERPLEGTPPPPNMPVSDES